MAKIGDLFMKDGVAYRVTAVPTEDITLYAKWTPAG